MSDILFFGCFGNTVHGCSLVRYSVTLRLCLCFFFFFSHSRAICFAHWLRILGHTSTNNILRMLYYTVTTAGSFFANFAMFLVCNYFLTIILILGVILFQVGLVSLGSFIGCRHSWWVDLGWVFGPTEWRLWQPVCEIGWLGPGQMKELKKIPSYT